MLPKQCLALLKLIHTKVYEKTYRLTDVFNSFNKGRAPPTGNLTSRPRIYDDSFLGVTEIERVTLTITLGNMAPELIHDGVLTMLNMGKGNPKLNHDLKQIIDLCVGEDGYVSYTAFAEVFKRRDRQDHPLLEGNAVRQFAVQLTSGIVVLTSESTCSPFMFSLREIAFCGLVKRQFSLAKGKLAS